MDYRLRLGNVKWSLTGYYSPSLVTLHGLIRLTTFTSPNSLRGILPGLCTAGPSELCPSPQEQQDGMSPGWNEPLGMEQGVQLQICGLQIPKQGLWGETASQSQGFRVGKPIPVAKVFLSPKSAFFKRKWGFPPTSHQEQGCSVITSSEHRCSNLL